jgi:AmmeMemoRadiSam system protein B
MSQIRPAAVAGSFYPADPISLQDQLNGWLPEIPVDPAARPAPKAIISPHAGYIYSGEIAARAYSQLRPAHDQFHRVVLIGPAHRVGFRGIALPSSDQFATPLGQIPIDDDLRQRALELDEVITLDQAHQFEHCLEVQLPFLQRVLDDFTLLPMLAGQVAPSRIDQLLENLAMDRDTLIVISSDLSHFLDYDSARQSDTATATAIEQLAPEAIGEHQACGRLPIQGLLLFARRHGMQVERLDLRNSGDTAGPRHQVVGYGAWRLDP